MEPCILGALILIPQCLQEACVGSEAAGSKGMMWRVGWGHGMCSPHPALEARADWGSEILKSLLRIHLTSR